MNTILKKYFINFLWFYNYLKYKVFIGIVLSILVGLLDGFGLTMFLPLLQMVSENDSESSAGMGKLEIVVDIINSFGIKLTLLPILGFMVLFFTLKGIVKYISEVYKISIQQQLLRKIRLSIINLLERVNYKYFILNDLGRIQNSMTSEIDRIQQAYNFYFQTFEYLFLVIVYMGFAYFVDYKFAILVTFGGLLTNFLYSSIYKKTKAQSSKFSDNSNTFQGQVAQLLSNFKYLRATNSFDKFSKLIYGTVLDVEHSRRKIGVYSSYLTASREPLLIIVVVSVIYIQISLLEGSLGPILISLLFFYRALTSLTTVQNSWNRFLGVSGSINNFSSFKEDLKSNLNAEQSENHLNFKKSIVISDLSLQLDGNLILDSINLKIEKNKSIALIGESGSGKTTLVNVISGLYEPDRGELKVDGKNVFKENLKGFQRKIGYITQEPVIFNDSIYNNITLWSKKTESNLKKFEKATKAANINKFINDTSNGIDTILGSSGVNLSGGQKQRISIARELFKEIDILIMDEATSALDSVTENYIQESIENLKGKFTLIIIAHRLSTIRNVDKIVLINKGQIVDV